MSLKITAIYPKIHIYDPGTIVITDINLVAFTAPTDAQTGFADEHIEYPAGSPVTILDSEYYSELNYVFYKLKLLGSDGKVVYYTLAQTPKHLWNLKTRMQLKNELRSIASERFTVA